MAPTKDWHSIIAAKSHQLPPEAARQLRDIGFIVMPGPEIQGGCEQLSRAYAHAVAMVDARGPIRLMCILAGPDLRRVLMMSSIAGRSSIASTFTCHC
ncbi:MAG TPA: hypothetical protein VLL54_16335 [Pyrinomonadaceae bacterium]|nr:hypothetical protein [Pyrinomonadaceae bacterium]